MQNPVPHAERQHWIGVLARARRSELQPFEDALRDIEYQLIRAPPDSYSPYGHRPGAPRSGSRSFRRR